MPAGLLASLIEARDEFCPDGYTYSNGYCYSPWSLYGRWVLLGAIIVGAFLLFCCFSCITSRRRRRQGMQPFRGTGWAGGPPPYQAGGYQQGGGQYYGGAPPQQEGYGGQPQQPWQQPPPQYGAQDGSHFGKTNNQPYGQESGSVELQSPGQSYQRGGDNVYQPPPGPPPGKGDGIIR